MKDTYTFERPTFYTSVPMAFMNVLTSSSTSLEEFAVCASISGGTSMDVQMFRISNEGVFD